MAKSKRFWRYDKNGIKTEVQYGTNSDNVDIGDENLTEVISSIKAANNESLKYQGNYANGASLDYFNADIWYGIWRIGAAYEPPDLPIARASNENVLLVVTKAYGNNSSNCKQELIYTKQNLILFRFCYDSIWSSWQTTVGANPDIKDGRQIVAFTSGSRGTLTETDVVVDNILRSDVTNTTGDFKTLTLPFAAASADEASNTFISGAYYDMQSVITPTADGLGHDWRPLYNAAGQGGALMVEGGDFAHNDHVVVKHYPIILPQNMFSGVVNYSSASNEFKFRIIVIADIPADTSSRDLISVFNGNTTVQRRGSYGIRIVSKRGSNGNSLATSDYITESGLCAIALECSNKAGNLTLTVCPLNSSFTEESPGMVTETLDRTDNAYVGTYTQGTNYIVNAETAPDGIPVYAVYTETAKGAAALSSATVSEIISKMQDMLKPKQAEAATVNYVNMALQKRKFEQYRTSPVQVGTWIDGTPIWRIAFKRTLTQAEINANSVNIADLVSIGSDIYNSFVINSRAYIYLGSPCVIDDIACGQLTSGSFALDMYKPSGVTLAAGNDGIYGFVDHVTNASYVPPSTSNTVTLGESQLGETTLG